jgi:hypothetical protein
MKINYNQHSLIFTTCFAVITDHITNTSKPKAQSFVVTQYNFADSIKP